MAELTRWQVLDLLNRKGPLWLTGVDLSGLNLSRANLEGADLVLTYVTNSLSFTRLVVGDNLYYPRFLRASYRD